MKRGFCCHSSSEHVEALLGFRKKSFFIVIIRLLWIYGRQGPLSHQMLWPHYAYYISVQLDITFMLSSLMSLAIIMLSQMLFPVFRSTVSDNYSSSTTTGLHPCMASPVLEGLLSQYQSLGVTASTHRTYQTEIRAFQQFCYQFSIPSIPTSPLTLCYFCASVAHRISHKAIKVYLAEIHLEHLERGF